MNNYSMPVQYQQPQSPQIRPEVNAVKIELNNPQAYGSAPESAPIARAPLSYQQAPTYAYPQAQIYPAAPNYAPVAPMPFIPQQPLPAAVQQKPAPEPPAANFVPTQPVAAKEVPAALVDQKVPEKKTPNADELTKLPPGQETKPAINIKPIVGSLKSENLDEQFDAIQQLAELGQNKKVPSDLLLNDEVFTNLRGVITKDTANLQGPSAEQQDLRTKKFNGEQLTPEQDTLAETLAPQEVAEMNKQYATYTLAVVQKNFRDSVNKEAEKQGLEPVKLNEIPEMETVVDNIKSNPNPLVREASISALSYVAKPEDKETLGVILSVATNDADPSVKESAQKAQDKVNNLI